MAGADVSEGGKSRREVLKAVGAAAAGALAGGVLKADSAEAGHGVINASSNDPAKPAIHAEHTYSDGGAAIEARASNGTGLLVTDAFFGADIAAYQNGLLVRCVESDCIRAHSDSDTGVRGTGVTGVIGHGTDVGVVGSTSWTKGVGVVGVTKEGISVLGEVGGRSNPRGVAVQGNAGGESSVGVLAYAAMDTATALQVQGRAQFSTASSGMIPAGQDSGAVSNPLVTVQSHVTVTLTGDPGQASSTPGTKPVVVWVERQPGTGFVVHLSRAVRMATQFTYLIVEPG
jgi:hypothetical protein